MSGWIKLHRDIEDHWIFKDSEVFKRWIRLLMMANFEESKILVGGNVVTIGKGQMILSQENIAEKWKISRQTLRTFLNHLEKDGMILRDFAQKSNHKITILTICNYSKYQDLPTTNQPLINHRATTEQPQSNQIKESKELKECKERDISTNVDIVNFNKKSRQKKQDTTPYEEILKLYETILPELTQLYCWTEKRKNQLKSLWEDQEELPTLADWEKYFGFIRASPFLMGKVPPINGHKQFKGSLEWITNKTNYINITERKYHEARKQAR
ncbi:MAG: hypothetical protein WC901_00915 [Candidatus Margulisiibacteriota bacterium]